MPGLSNLTERIIGLLEKDPGQQIQQLARELKLNRTFLAGYLLALGNEGYVKSKRIRLANVYFKENKR